MHQIAYSSRATVRLSHEGLGSLCEQSSAYNLLHDITGLLVFDRVRYMQVIEGSVKAVKQLMAQIAVDTRHDRIVSIIDAPIKQRAFDDWALACIDYDDALSPIHFLDKIKERVRLVADVRVKAALIGFALLSQ